jgi:hypothetical protein
MELTAEKAEAALPTDMGNLYRSWVEGNPSKVNRLAEIVAVTVEAFRQSVKTHGGILMEEAPSMIPTTGYQHAFNLVVFNLGMEMGVQFAPEVYSLNVQANVWLRMVQTGRLRPVPLEPTAEGTPNFQVRQAKCRRLSEVGRLEW